MSSKSYLQRFQMVSLKANQCIHIKKYHHKRQRLLLRIYQPHAFATLRASLHTSTTREKATITLSPSPALFDQETRVVIEGLLAKQPVTVAATFENDAGRFMSHAFYEADNQGTVDLSTSPALGGRYTGVEPMGFLWSMTGSDESRPGLFYFKKNLPVPDDVHLYVLSGHTQATSMKHIETTQVLCETPHQRTFMVEGVKRSLVREGRLRGSLYLPPGDGPFPGVINIYGLTPGLHDIRAALLANKGFATLGLAYFGYDDLSPISTTMEQEVNMEYFEEAVEWFSSHPLVSPPGIGVMGYSKSCDLVMYMAIMSSRVKATVAINGFNFYTSFKHYKDGHLLPSFRDHVDYAVDTPEGITFVDSLPAAPISEDCLIPLLRNILASPTDCNITPQPTSTQDALCVEVTPSQDMPIIEVHPSPAMFDEEVRVRVEGLTANQPITLVATVKTKPAWFISHAHYTADEQGDVDARQHSAQGGSYTGIEPMGFIWSLKGVADSRPGMYYIKSNLPHPDYVNIYVLAGHVTITSLADISANQMLCKTLHRRDVIGPGVRRILIDEGRVHGSLCIPPGEGPFPGVIDISGLARGLHDLKACLLANRGFICLGLAYYGYRGLPDSAERRLDMEVLEDAVEWLTNHPLVSKSGIGVVGYSKGCDLALHTALISPKVKATVTINGFHFYTSLDHYKDGKLLPSFKSHSEYFVNTDEGVIYDPKMFDDPRIKPCLIPVENAPWTEYMFVVGEEDMCVYPVCADLMIQRLKDNNLNNYRELRYPNVGHILEMPYSPAARSVYNSNNKVIRLFGGDLKFASEAQTDAMNKIVQFFKEKLL